MARYNENDIARVVRNFNNKIKRLEKLDSDLKLPDKVTTKEIRSKIRTKFDLNRELSKLERLTTKNASEIFTTNEGVKLSRYEFEELKREQKRIVSKLNKQISDYSKIKPTEFGKSLDLTYAQMGDEYLSNLKARKKAIQRRNIKKLDTDNLRQLKGLLNKAEASYRKDKTIFYDNYLSGSLLNTAYYVGYDMKKIQYIQDKLYKLTPNQFIKLYNSEESLKALQDRYIQSKVKGMTPEDMEEDVEELLDNLYKNIDKIIEDYK